VTLKQCFEGPQWNIEKRTRKPKNLCPNYMMQLQALIDQNAIEAQGAKKLWW
jgi:hypothetical protein